MDYAKNNDKSFPWSSAAMDGLKLSFIVIICTLLIFVAGKLPIPAWALSVMNLIIWFAQFSISVKRLQLYMVSAVVEQKTDRLFPYGFTVCFFSSIVCAFFFCVYYQWILPPADIEEVLTVFDTMKNSLPQANTDAIAYIQDHLVQTISISTFLKCIFEGFIFSAICALLSRNATVISINDDGDGSDDNDDDELS
ncbi:MAG: hypothetical protein HUJ90_06340 [Bacteroidales bacterium]|nr:hypothetical protein [Bacteroidales bacterium]